MSRYQQDEQNTIRKTRTQLIRMTNFSIRTLLILTLLTAAGVVVYQYLNRPVVISEVPRPNSGRFTTVEAEDLLDGSLAQSIGISIDHPIIQEWKNPFIGFHAHVDRRGKITVTDFFGQTSTGMKEFKSSVELTCSLLEGNPGGVLLTSDTSGWDTPEKRAIVESVFEPSIQIYVVTLLNSSE